MSCDNNKTDPNIALNEFNQIMNKIEYWTGFWQ